MKVLKVLLMSLLVVGLAVPGFAAHMDDDENWRFNITQIRYRFNWNVASDYVGGTSDTIEFFDDDFDTVWRFNKGDIEIYFEWEIADNNMGNDYFVQPTYDEAIGNYSGKWTPESLADREFRLEAGDFGTGWGRRINNDDSPRGSIEIGTRLGGGTLVVGYGKTYEGNINDNTEGDGSLVRGQWGMPIGESGWNFSIYAAYYNQYDVNLQEASVATVNVDPTTNTPIVLPEIPNIQGDQNVFLGSLDFSGTGGPMNLYGEFGFSSGKTEKTRDTNGDGIDDALKKINLKGWYLMAGAAFAAGQWDLGFEGGYGSGDDDPTDQDQDDFTAVNTDFWIGQIMHDEGMIVNSAGKDGSLSNLWYLQFTGVGNLTEKWSTSAGIVYLAPTKDAISQFTLKTVDKYGVELFGDFTYDISQELAWVLFWGVAFPDTKFIDDTQYQITNRLEFNF